jgi:hypothetical protein
MDRPGRRRVRELLDCIIDAAPDRHSGIVAHLRKFVSPPGTFLHRCFAVPPEHQAGGAPNVDLGYHRLNAKRGRSINV